jgi:hypothetical protein
MANQRADEILLGGFIGIGATGVVVRLNDDIIVKLPRICKDPEATPE